MYRQGYDLSDAEKKAIAEFLAGRALGSPAPIRSEEHTSELQSRGHIVCRLLLEKKIRHDACVRRSTCHQVQKLLYHRARNRLVAPGNALVQSFRFALSHPERALRHG